MEFVYPIRVNQNRIFDVRNFSIAHKHTLTGSQWLDIFALELVTGLFGDLLFHFLFSCQSNLNKNFITGNHSKDVNASNF